jgi:hypothetical protein
LFCLSFGAALFALTVFKLLSFFVMPSLFFDLLFIGFPLGALLGARSLQPDRRTFLRSLCALQAIMALSVAFCLLGKRFDYLRAHLFDIRVPELGAQVAIFVALFLPFFALYGLCEYLGYRVGSSVLAGRMRRVYALALFGAAAAYVALKGLLPLSGIVALLAASFAAIALAAFFLARGPSRWLLPGEIGLLGLAAALPGTESVFLNLHKGTGYHSTWDFIVHQGCRPVFQRWGRYSLCEILEDTQRGRFYGFYNDMFQWEYAPPLGFAQPSLGAVPILMTRPGQRLAIVGSGGGRQVALAQRLGGRTVLGIEIEPAVFLALRSRAHLRHRFQHVYDSPGVIPVQAEARSYLEHSRDAFDLIYLPSVGGYPQMMIEPGNMVRTKEAYALMRDRLTPEGILAIWYPLPLDKRGILTSQYVRTLESLGVKTVAFCNDFEFLILGFRNPRAVPPSTDDVARLLRLDSAAPSEIQAHRSVWPRPYEVDPDPGFVPVTDQRPYLAGNVRYVLSMDQVRTLFLMGASAVGLSGLLLGWALRKRGDPALPGRPYRSVAGLALLIGANFLLMEHALVLSLFQRLYVYDDALALGVVGFLTLSGLGSLFSSPRFQTVAAASAVGLLGFFLLAGSPASAFWRCLFIAPAAMLSGSFFPVLFDRTSQNPLAVFAFDSVGAGLGALLATFVPIALGIDAFYLVAAGVFVLTVIADRCFHGRPLDASVPLVSALELTSK